MTKIVTQLDAAGYLVGPVVAEESPLQQGAYLVPAGCIHEVPPIVPQGMRARWQLGAWTFEALTAEPDTQPAPETVEQWRGRALVSRFQARAALHLAGVLPQVQTMMDSPTTDMLARLAWQDAQEFRRMSPTVVQMGAALGMTDLQLDALFKQAATIQA